MFKKTIKIKQVIGTYERIIITTVYGCSKVELQDNIRKAKAYYNEKTACQKDERRVLI